MQPQQEWVRELYTLRYIGGKVICHWGESRHGKKAGWNPEVQAHGAAEEAGEEEMKRSPLSTLHLKTCTQ